MKRCTGCKITKPLTDFNKDRSRKDGLDWYCKVCNRNNLQYRRHKAQNYIAEPKAAISYIREILRTTVQDNQIILSPIQRYRLSKQLYKKLLNNPKCRYTGENLVPRVNLSLDHIKPIARGGRHVISNLEWISRRANQAKTDMTPEEFYLFCETALKLRAFPHEPNQTQN